MSDSNKRCELGTRFPSTVVALSLLLGLLGCGNSQENAMNSETASEQLDVAVRAVQRATGTEWVLEVEPGPIGCASPDLEHLTTSWRGVPTVDQDAAYKAVREALKDVGFESRILGPESKTPTIASQTGGGFGLDFAYPIEGGPLYLNVGSDCFPREEWPDEEG